MADEKDGYGVYSKCQASKLKEYDTKKKTKYDKSKSETLDTEIVLSASYAKTMSSNYKATGIYYKLDEKKTEKYMKDLEAKKKKLG